MCFFALLFLLAIAAVAGLTYWLDKSEPAYFLWGAIALLVAMLVCLATQS
jgi:hypothetical protein